jgi:mannose-6-phosphate isomerase-like protein (cupin superfamily)
MRIILSVVALVLFAPLAFAQQQPAAAGAAGPPKLFASAAEVAAMIEKARSGMKPGQPAAGDWILKLDPSATTPGATFPTGHVHLDCVTAVIPNAALVHERRAELFYILDGSGVVILGGTLHDEQRANAETRRGSGIDGGAPQRLSKGDFLIIPENTPHFISQVDSPLVFMSLMMPHPDGLK